MMHERNGGYHEPCLHCQNADLRATLAKVDQVIAALHEIGNTVGDLAREDIEGDDGIVRYRDLRLAVTRALGVVDA